MSKVSMDLTKEKKLIRTAQKGGEAGRSAFEAIYVHYKPHLEKFFRARLGAKTIIDDLVADVFTKALNGLDSFRWQGVSLSAWLYKISRNVLIDYFREEDKRKSASIKDIAPPETKEEGPSELAAKAEEYNLLHRVLETLPKREQKIIYLKFFEGRRNKDIAEMMNLSETNVGTIVHRTMKNLKEELNKKLDS